MTRAGLLAQAEEAAREALRSATEEYPLIRQLEALRLTLAASLEPEELAAELVEAQVGEACFPDPIWARLELFGHNVIYGLVGEVFYAGRTFLEVTVPAIWINDELRDGPPDFPESVKTYHPNAVYALAPRPADEVMDTLRRQRGLYLHADGTWHTERELVSVELDLEALEARDEDDRY